MTNPDPRYEASFTMAFQELYPRAVRLARRILGSGAAAEDVAAEAMTRALAHWDRIGDSESYRTGWVLRVTTNLAIDAMRRRERLADPTDLPEAAVDDQDALTLRVALVEALRALPQRQREAVALRYLAGLSQAEAAAALGISTGSVAQHVHRGLRVLRGKFDGPFPISKEKPLKISTMQEAIDIAGTDRRVEARVLGVGKIGWQTDIGIPAVLIARGQSRGQSVDPETLVGQDVECQVVEVDEVRDRVVVALPVASDETVAFDRRREAIRQLSVGEVRTGRVVSVVPFGAFVDVGDVHGLVHGATGLEVGQSVEVEVEQTNPDLLRVSLQLTL